MNDWKNSPIFCRADGSFLIDYSGYSEYHVPNNEEFAALWAEVRAYAQAHPDQVTHLPADPEPTEEELLAHAKVIKGLEFQVIDAKYRDELVELSIDLLAASISPQTISAEDTGIQEKQERFFKLRQVRVDNKQREDAMLAATTVASVEAIIPITLDEPDTPVVQGYTI